MNPLTGSLKYFASTLFNSLIAFVFFLIAAHFTSPSFVGKVAIIQLMETITGSFFALLPNSLITREISYNFTSKKNYEIIGYTTLSYALLVSPFFLFLFFFPSYLWLSIPYFILYLFSFYQSYILSGLGKFTEVNIGNFIFSILRWGISIIAIFYNSITLLIIIWTVGALVKVLYYNFFFHFKFTINSKIMKEIVKVGFPIYLSGIVGFFSIQGDRLMTAYLLGSYYLGIYQLVALASLVPGMIISSISSAVLPSATHYYVKGINLKEMSSLTIRILTPFSLLLGILGYAISPYFIRLFPQYESGLPVLKILILFLTITMPLQFLSTFLIVAKKNYIPFIIISIISGSEVVGVSYFLIPKLGILGAGITQAINVILTSVLLIFFTAEQEILVLDRKVIFSIILISLSVISLVSWILALAIVLIGLKLSKILNKEDVYIILNFSPFFIKRFIKILYLFI